jgi:truncated hemoglobin YjbI
MARRRSRPPIATIATLAPAVVALRLPALMAEAMSHAGPRPETTRALTEKMAATAEGVMAMQLSLVTAGFRAWGQMMAGSFDQAGLHRAHAAAVDAALKPMARRVSANLKRLGG